MALQKQTDDRNFLDKKNALDDYKILTSGSSWISNFP